MMTTGQPDGGKSKRLGHTPIQKALAIVKLLAAARGPVGVQAIAAATGLNVSTTHRLLQHLVGDAMASYDPRTRTYGVGTECVRLATAVLGSDSLIGRVRPLIAQLAVKLDETCALFLYEPANDTKVLAVVEHGTTPLGYAFEVGSRDGLHAGASGKAILAFLQDGRIDRILGQPLPKLTESTIVDPAELRRQVQVIRRQGYATSGGERVPGAGFGAAAPVFRPGDDVFGCVVVTIPAFRTRPDRLPAVADEVVRCARIISALADASPGAGASWGG